MDGYTYMIERNKLMIQNARTRELSSPAGALSAQAQAQAQVGADTVGANTGTPEREQLMDLYSKLEGCGRLQGNESE